MPTSSDPCFICTDNGGTCALSKGYKGFLKDNDEQIEKHKPREGRYWIIGDELVSIE